jgi:hypothetical protein
VNFPVAMALFAILFVGGALAFYKVMEYFGVPKFTEKKEKPSIKPH